VVGNIASSVGAKSLYWSAVLLRVGDSCCCSRLLLSRPRLRGGVERKGRGEEEEEEEGREEKEEEVESTTRGVEDELRSDESDGELHDIRRLVVSDSGVVVGWFVVALFGSAFGSESGVVVGWFVVVLFGLALGSESGVVVG